MGFLTEPLNPFLILKNREMNIENISALVGQLQSLGFENSGHLLLKRISFKPDNFTLSQNVDKGKDKLMFQLFFEKDSKQNVAR